MSIEIAPAPQPIPAPPDFPVSWAMPGDEQLLWQRDLMHFPNVTTPLEDDYLVAIGDGFTSAFSTYEIPLAGARYHVANGHAYITVVPLLADPDEIARRDEASAAKLAAVMERLEERWNRELLPEVKEHITAIESLDVASAPADRMAAHLADAFARLARAWEIHFEIITPAYLAVSEFDELYTALFEPDDQFASHRLLQGIPNMTVETGSELWRLAEWGRASEDVRSAFGEADTAAVLDRLGASEAGREFLGELGRYLDAYGRRGQTWGLASPSWVEDPTPVIVNLRDFIGSPSAADPRVELARLAADREQAVAGARDAMAGYPADIVDQFESMLRAAQEGIAITEDHNFWIDFRATDAVRQTVLAAGRRFVEAGVLDAADDVLMLHSDEIVVTARQLPAIDRRALVASRRAEREAFTALAAPPVLGSLPPGPPPDNPITRFVLKFFGTPPRESERPDVIYGAAGSAGTVRGTARVIGSLADAHRLGRGEILVAQTTSPPWTPLFATAAAVITETGGILSHAAVVAREYAVPAVIGAAGATTAIRDGQTIEVDGDAGVIRILD